MKALMILIASLIIGVGGPGVVGAKPVSLDWNDNTEADLAGYKVYRGTVSGGPYSEIASVTESFYTDEVTVDGSYFWVVTAYDTEGLESGYSNEVSLVLDTTPPEPPTGLQAIWQVIVSFFKKLFGGLRIA